MPRNRGHRRRLAKGIFADDAGISVIAGSPQREKRFPLGTELADLKEARKQLAREVAAEKPKPVRGELLTDTERYIALVKPTLASWMELRAELRAWIKALGPHRSRHKIGRLDAVNVRGQWATDGVAPKTINNRMDALRRLYRALDGDDCETPCDGIDPLPVPRTPIHRIDPDLILRVDAQLQAHETCGWLRDRKTRARFRVIMTSGRRPSEVGRIQPNDLDFINRVWVPRDGKGGFTPGIYMNGDLLEALLFFDEANAYGEFNESSFVRVLHTAGWPEDIRPYQGRHTVGITLSEAGHDLADIGPQLGHKRLETTRKHYTPVLNSRMQAMSETLDGRFKGWQNQPAAGPRKKASGPISGPAHKSAKG